MHMKWHRSGDITFEEFCTLVPDGQKADLIDGIIYMASPDTYENNDLFAFLFAVMRLYAEDRELGKILGSRMAFRLAERSGPEPDVAFIRSERLGLAGGGFFPGHPDLAVEVVSGESVERDYVTKRELYRKAGVSEYWIIDEHFKRVTMLRLGPRKRYHEVKPRRGIYRSLTLPGFWFRAEWFWQDPLPPVLSTFNQIVGGPP
jgi:Uma2 family endonuclease